MGEATRICHCIVLSPITWHSCEEEDRCGCVLGCGCVCTMCGCIHSLKFICIRNTIDVRYQFGDLIKVMLC